MTTCPCCNTTGLDRDDFVDASFYNYEWIDALEEKYGGPVCDYCADIENTPCEYCEAPIRRGEHCEECEAERIEAAAHEKSEKHGWEQV